MGDSRRQNNELRELREMSLHQAEALGRVLALADRLDRLSPGDQHYARRIRDAVKGA